MTSPQQWNASLAVPKCPCETTGHSVTIRVMNISLGQGMWEWGPSIPTFLPLHKYCKRISYNMLTLTQVEVTPGNHARQHSTHT